MTTEKINKKPGRITDYSKTLPILELYTCIQSEGSRQGRPTVAVRTTGCTHRCWFGAGGWCDSWYTSIHPGKGTYTFNDIIKIYDENPNITEMMLTGGSPTMQPDLVNELTHFANERGIFITIETEGSHFVETDYPIGLISLSPKFSNSVPKLDVNTPMGKLVDQKMIDKHNSLRLNHQAIEQTLAYHSDYHYKPVYDGTEENIQEIEEFRVRHNIPKNKTWLMPAGDNSLRLNHQAIEQTLAYHSDYHYKPVYDGTEENIQEIEEFRVRHNIPKNKTWLMPAGDNREELIKQYPISLEKAFEMGYNWTGRDHIISYDTKRAV